jgi:hypothetical protein
MNHTLQHQFFERIKQKLDPHLSLVNEIADVLEVSNDSAYRRLRGETAISLDEAAALAQHFGIALPESSSGNHDAVLGRHDEAAALRGRVLEVGVGREHGARDAVKEHAAALQRMDASQQRVLAAAADLLIRCFRTGNTLLVCGNGGSKPRHADLLAGDLDDIAGVLAKEQARRLPGSRAHES